MAVATIIQEACGYLAEAYPTLQTPRIGAEYVMAEGAPPRVVWVPTEDGFESIRLQKAEPRALRTRRAGCDVYIWAKGSGSGVADLDAVEVLVNDVISAIHRANPGNYRLNGGQWVQMAQGQHGRAYRLSLTFEIPITLRKGGTTQVPLTATVPPPAGQANIQQDTGITFPDGTTVSGTPGP